MIGSALVVLVLEAEASVKPFRDRHDPSAAAGMPAHITLLYPFKPPDETDDFVAASRGSLPIRATASEVALMDNRSGRWQVRAMFGLGRAA
jgi:hypothetical protein